MSEGVGRFKVSLAYWVHMTLRDDAWHVILLSQIARVSDFKRRDLGFGERQRHTVQRVLNEMEAKGWVSRNRPQSGNWHPGVLSRFYFGRDNQLTQSDMEAVEGYLEPVAEQTGLTVEALLAEGCPTNTYPSEYRGILNNPE